MPSGWIRQLAGGYGVIRMGDGRGPVVFTREDSPETFDRLQPGQRVEFILRRTPKGRRALQVRPVSETGSLPATT